jgi:dihydroorotate dehydrogenase electron transfer subunit
LNRIFKASVKENKQLIKNHYLLTLQPLERIKQPQPGNFFMLSVDSGLDPLLKRPISIHRWLGSDFQLLYRIVGKGTKILSQRKPGDILDILGPLGNSFPYRKTQTKSLLVAGGLGIAPILALAEKITPPAPPLIKKGEKRALASGSKGDLTTLLFYGARTKEEVLCRDELKSIGIEPIISTDDGSFGKKGDIVSVLNKYIAHDSSPLTQYSLFACGPEPMLKSLSALARKKKLGGYVALEQNMACGVGTCLGCVVNTTKGYKRVCKEGPVFPVEEIVWE